MVSVLCEATCFTLKKKFLDKSLKVNFILPAALFYEISLRVEFTSLEGGEIFSVMLVHITNEMQNCKGT